MLRKDWNFIVRKAWSIRLIALAAILTFAEVAINVCVAYGVQTPIRNGIFALLAGVVACAAFAARLIAQKEFRVDEI